MNILSLENITHSYTERKLFDEASFYLHEGEKVGIIGINGTGKSTLLKIMAGLEIPDEGQVIKAANMMIHYLPQNPIFNYHCLCFKFALFGLDVLATREPMGMCSTCAYELRYSLKNPEINAKTQKLEFKRIWQQYLEDQGYPKLSFKPIWKEYLEERRNLRKHYIELHFKDFLANADFTQKEYLL